MRNTEDLFVLAPFSIGDHPVRYSCSRTSFRHNITCAILVRHFLMHQKMQGQIQAETADIDERIAQAIFETALNEMIGSVSSMPPEAYLDALTTYMVEVTRDNGEFQDPWMPAFLNEEIMHLGKAAAELSVPEINQDLVDASQQLIRNGEGVRKTAKEGKARTRKPTRKERNRQKRMLRDVARVL